MRVALSSAGAPRTHRGRSVQSPFRLARRRSCAHPATGSAQAQEEPLLFHGRWRQRLTLGRAAWLKCNMYQCAGHLARGAGYFTLGNGSRHRGRIDRTELPPVRRAWQNTIFSRRLNMHLRCADCTVAHISIIVMSSILGSHHANEMHSHMLAKEPSFNRDEPLVSDPDP